MRGETLTDRNLNLDEEVIFLPDWGLVVGHDGEAKFLRILGHLDRGDREGVGHAHERGRGFTFEGTDHFERRDHRARLALLHRRQRNGGSTHKSEVRGEFAERRGVENTASTSISFAHDNEFPGLDRHCGISVQLEDALVAAFGNRLLTKRRDSWRRPDHHHPNRGLEAFLALRGHMQIKDAVLHQRDGRFNNLERIGSLFDHGEG